MPSEESILAVQDNLASTYQLLGRGQQALHMRREVYSGGVKIYGTEHRETLVDANNVASSLMQLIRFEEARSLLRKMIPVVRRVLGNSDEVTLKMMLIYANALSRDPGATLDDLREAVNTLEDLGRTAWRVMGGEHPITTGIEDDLRDSRATLRARETPPSARTP